MSDPQVATLECLLRRLEEVLGQDSLLLRRFQVGLRQEDEHWLTDAMHSLRLYPPHTRRLVEDTVMSWLFGGEEKKTFGRRQASPKA